MSLNFWSHSIHSELGWLQQLQAGIHLRRNAAENMQAFLSVDLWLGCRNDTGTLDRVFCDLTQDVHWLCPQESGIAFVRGLSLVITGIVLVGLLLWLAIRISSKPAPSIPGPDHPSDGSTATLTGSGVEAIWDEWPRPQLALMLSGEQHGYFEPCGCTSNQLGGMARRADLLKKLTEAGWDVRGIDLGGLPRRTVHQAQVKFEMSLRALQDLQYVAVGLGPEDLRLQPEFLLAQDIPDETGEALRFVSANIVFFNSPELGTPIPSRIMEVGGRRVAITSVVSESTIASVVAPGSNGDINWTAPEPAIEQVLQDFDAQQIDFRILLSHSPADESRELARRYPKFDVIVTAQGFSDPNPADEPERIGDTVFLQVGHKGKYVGILGLYPDDAESPLRYQLVPLDGSDFDDAQQMTDHMKVYQERLREQQIVVTDGVISHPSGESFVGVERCGECHEHAYDVWAESRHAHAFESLDPANELEGHERLNGVRRTFDPECLSCHVTGWEPQEYIRYRSGWLNKEFAETEEQLSLESRLAGNQCENCHGPGSRHIELIEADEYDLAKKEVAVTLEQARKTVCRRCHDSDNSPEFDFDSYWTQIEHYEPEHE